MIEISFLLVGHTHEDIDQFFSRIAKHLQSNNAITVNQLIEAVKHAYTPSPIVRNMKNVANFKQYMIEQDWLNTMTGIFINIIKQDIHNI